jgi:hypothetical protein
MRMLRCKCGKREAWTSQGMQPCEGCEECNTTYASHPKYHDPLQPHIWITRYNQNTGKPYKLCSRCFVKDQVSYEQSQKSD